MKAVMVMLLMAVMLCTLATPAVAGEWIQGPISGKPVYCDYFPEWNETYGYYVDQYYCYGLKGDFWVRTKPGWQNDPHAIGG